MKLRLGYHVRNLAKMAVQNCVLPVAYWAASRKYRGEKTLYVFADAHHTDLPFSLEAMYRHVEGLGITPVTHFYDYTHEGSVKSLRHAISFMEILAQAKYVFICDTFMPVSSGPKAPGTRIVQLNHFSGPFKRIGYATNDDVPGYYKGNVFKNYDLVTASSETYVPLLTQAMRQEAGIVQALGVSRSDVYFDPNWVETCKKEFYSQFPEAKNKKILLWAPTFRGKASSPDTLDNESLASLQDKLGEDWLVLIKHHPHDDATARDPRHRSNCAISSERLLPVVDLLITDYSTVVLDYLAFDRPFILYAPDLDEYEASRGFFIDYRSLTENLTTTADGLDRMVRSVYDRWLDGDREDIRHFRRIFTAACDGHATERILDHIRGLDGSAAEKP